MGVTFTIGKRSIQNGFEHLDPHAYSAGVEQRAVGYPTPPLSDSSVKTLLTEHPRKSKIVQEVNI